MTLLQPKEITITTQDGKDRTYVISKFPAVQGREIICKYPLSAAPKLGDYQVNEETMLKLMAYVGVKTDGATVQPLSTRALVDNHVPDWETLMHIEWAMIEYNTSFFQNGRASTFLKGFAEKLPALISKMLTGLSEQSLQKEKQASQS